MVRKKSNKKSYGAGPFILLALMLGIGASDVTDTSIIDAAPIPTGQLDDLPLAACIDTDGGKDPYIFGTVSTSAGARMKDSCFDSWAVYESSCNENKWAGEEIKCDIGDTCSNGSCFTCEDYCAAERNGVGIAKINADNNNCEAHAFSQCAATNQGIVDVSDDVVCCCWICE